MAERYDLHRAAVIGAVSDVPTRISYICRMQDGGPGGGEFPAQLQQHLDELASAVGHSVSLDSPDGRLLAYSAQATDVDPVRIAAILTRKVPDDVLAYQRSQGIARASTAIRVAANPALQMSARTCLPIRRGQRVAAYLWVLDDDTKPLDAATVRLLETAGERIAQLLPSSDVAAIDAQLAALLAGDPRAELSRRIAELEGRVSGRLQFTCVVPTTVTAAERVPVPTSGPARDATTVVLGRAHDANKTLLLTTERADGRDASAHLATGTSPWFRAADVDGPRLAHFAARAIVCAGCAAMDAAVPLRATWDDLGLYRQLLLTTRPDSWSSTQLFGGDSAAAASLRHTLEAYLDRAGDAAATTAALGIHRTTFYYRLDRIRSLYGVDLNDGLTRSELHVRLKLRRLARAREFFGWSTALLAHLA